MLLESPYKPRDTPSSIAHLFVERAVAHPDQPFLRRRAADGSWDGVTYAEMERMARAVAAWLLECGLDRTGGVVILSGNSIEHAAMMLGCYLSATPSTALSQAFSMAGSDFGKLRHCFSVIRPKAVFVQSGRVFGAALDELRAIDPDVRIIAVDDADGLDLSFGAILAGKWQGDVDAAFSAIGDRTIAKYLFTSGSTGMPKAVPQTHGMMAEMVGARLGWMRYPDERLPGIALDWMPWSHLSAGNIGFNHNIWAGGTLYLDDGRPVGAAFAETVRNIAELSPPTFSSAPIAFEMLAGALEADTSLAAAFFLNLRWMAYGGAALSQDVADRLQRLAAATVGYRVPIVTTYGATEVQGITTVHWATDRVGLLGLPLPGVTLKLAPVDGKLEVRVKGPTVMQGYSGNETVNAGAFDEEGFYRLGDAARLVDPGDPAEGLLFDGRISEDFKLSSGTWVSVGTLRTAMIAAASPYVLDAVITGHDKPYVGALIWVSAEMATAPDLRERLRTRLRDFNAAQGGSGSISKRSSRSRRRSPQAKRPRRAISISARCLRAAPRRLRGSMRRSLTPR